VRAPLLLLAGSLGLPCPAEAQGGEDAIHAEARTHATEGQRLFEAKDYEAAVGELRAAEAVYDQAEMEVPVTLVRLLARSYDQLVQPVPALAYYKRFLARADGFPARADGSDPRLKEAVQRAKRDAARLQELVDQTVLTFEVEPDGTEVRLGRRVLGTTPLDPVKVSPGPHQVTLQKEGYRPYALVAEVRPGGAFPVMVMLVREPPPPERVVVVVERPGFLSRGLSGLRDSGQAWAAAALATAAVGAAVGSGVLFASAASLEKEGDAADAPSLGFGGGAANPASTYYEDAAFRRNVGWGLVTAAATAAGGLAYLFTLAAEERAPLAQPQEESDETDDHARVLPIPVEAGPNGQIGLGFRF